MSIDRDTRLYTVNEVLDTVRKTYEDKDEVWNFISDLTGISVDRLYEMMKEKGKTDIPAPSSCDGRFDIGDEKVDRARFEIDPDGYSNSYSSFLVIGKTEDEVIDALNRIATRGKYWHSTIYTGVCAGKQEDGNVRFNVMKGSPDLIYDLTDELHTIGYSMTDWSNNVFICAENGKDSHDFTAAWEDDSPYHHEDDEDEWDAFAVATDNRSGAEFGFGGGYVDTETKEEIGHIVYMHSV